MEMMKTFWRRAKETCLLMVGIPDYGTYVEHMQIFHPDRPVMSREEFFWNRQRSRYTVGKGRMHGGCS